jgi:ABC-type polysaccharide/polyol phosphate transport system ATPase subunit
MSGITDLVVDSVSKRYRVTQPRGRVGSIHTLRSRVRRALRQPSEEFWALRDVSFEVRRGETLGIIGDNGAGKSTLLKLLSNVTTPTEGQITIRGRLSALIEVGSGFHPELTGRENIYLSGSVLGMGRREIASKLERIIEFAGVSDFIDMPVKRYSTGMYLRLGFSIAAHLEPDILLLDEVLAVGDAEFQAKCLERVNELHRHGRTIVFISHDLLAVESLCRRVVLLSHGKVLADGPAREVIAMYQEMGRMRTTTEEAVPSAPAAPGEAEIVDIQVLDGHGDRVTAMRTGDAVKIRLHYKAKTRVPDAVFDVYVYSTLHGQHGPWCQLTTLAPDHDGIALEPGPGVIEFDVSELAIQPSECRLSAGIRHIDQPPGGYTMDWWQDFATLQVHPGREVRGTFYLPHRWATDRGVRSPAHAGGVSPDAAG